MSFVTVSPPPPLYFREHNIDHGHIYKLVSTLCRFSILQETVRGEGLTGNRNTKFNMVVVVIVTKDAIRNTKPNPYFWAQG